MYKIFLNTILLICLSFPLIAQEEEGIRFFQGSWKEALQQAINQVNERSAFTSNQVVMEETAQNLDQDRQTGVGYILKALDSLPESIRKFVTGLSFYQKSDGYYGLTQSLAGSTRLNTQYYNLQNFVYLI